MKKTFKSLIFLILVICPFFIKASGLNYEDTIHYVNNYIYKFPKYSNYLFFNDKLPYVYEDTDFVYDSKFKSGGLLSKTEFEMSNQKKNTYLSNGLEYWTSTKSSASRHYVVNYTLQEKLDSNTTGVRVTEYVNNNIGVSGNGSYSNPFQFSEIISLHVNTTNLLRGKISTTNCSNSSMKKETITLTFTEGTGANVYLCPENGYKVLSNSCSSYMTKDIGDKYIVNDVKNDNLICNIAFTYITNKVTLTCNDCNSNASPNVLYSSLSIHDKWFTDKNATTIIDKINTIPTKKGYTFKGYYNNGDLIINSSGKIVEDATVHITGDTTLNASMEANTYQITLNAPNATSNDHTKNQSVVFDNDMPSVVIPERTYTVNYNANSGSVSRTSDTISYTFEGYSYNNVKYINSNGSSAHKWDVDSNVTLTGIWAGGTFNLAIPTRSGHVFEGWSKNSDGSGTLYKGQQEIFNLMSGSNTSVTLYAKWTKCAAGTYLSSNSCVKCSAGYYSGAGADNCSVCAKNTYSSEGAIKCTTCTAGTYTEGTGSSSCIGCPVGSICPAGSEPQPCPVGYRCTATTKEECPPGYYSSGNAISCSRCPVGYYCPGKSDKIACPTGYTSNAQSSAENQCYIEVPDGKYLVTAKTTTQNNCPAGKFKAAHKVYYGSVSSCETCTAGYYCPGASNRIACSAGYYSGAGASSCTACATGSYTSTTGNSTCTACQGKTTSGTGKTSCDANCSNASNVSTWNTATWSANSVSNSCSIKTCSSGYSLSGGTCVSAIPGTRVTFSGSYWSWRSGSNCTNSTTCGTGMCNTVGVAHTELYVTEIKGSMVHGWFDISLLTSPGAGGNCLKGNCASVCKNTYAQYETKVVGGKTYAKIQLADVNYVFRCEINGEGC